MKKEIYILVGPAAIGKTTYLNNIGFPKDKLCLVSRDEVVADVSLRYNLSFDDLYHFPPHNATLGTYIPGFENYGKVIESPEIVLHLHPFSYQYLNEVNAEINYRFYNEFNAAIRNPNIDYVIVDRVHLRDYERRIYFEYLEKNRKDFFVTAVVFNFEDPDTLDIIEQMAELRKQNLIQSGQRTRTVKRKVQENMIKFYEPLKLEDGYDAIAKIDTLPGLRKFLLTKAHG